MIEMTLKNYREKIDNRLDLLMPVGNNAYSGVIEAARYSLFAGGKRIRPILLLEFYKLFGGDDDCAYNFACAIEMIHTYSLIHDDLPCMDDDDMRRGKPSNHIKFGEPLALLAGDALLTESFGVASRTLGIPSERVADAITFLSKNAGINGMVGGQVIDTCYEGDVDEDLLIKTHLLKTGALIKAASVCGAILAGADDESIKKVSEYAESVGLAFQIIDDLLDRQSTTEKLGKPVGSDQKNSKTTTVDLLGVEECERRAAALTEKAIDILDGFDGDTTVLKELTGYLLKRNY
ncbi:MAG: polyprenyl synthetase family protein [Clostridia bacterium]|nr:polyprenyl synthetase family protein [Clostridia bacterium]